jgi:metal-responsive CopG/Arc/MetJ family transcriptional regulator
MTVLETMNKTTTFIYQMVSIGSMSTQINLRMPQKLLSAVKSYSDEHGFGSVQEFIKETIREKLFDDPEISEDELKLVNKLVAVSEKKKLYGTEKQLFEKLRRK